MKKYLTLVVVPLFVLASQMAAAEAMSCGTHMIEDGQSPGQSRSDVEKQCGAPERSSGNNLYYRIDDATYRLHFNDGDELESISVEQE